MPAAHSTMLGASAGVQPRRSRRRPNVSHLTSITMDLPVREDVVGNGGSDAGLGIFADGYLDEEHGEQHEQEGYFEGEHDGGDGVQHDDYEVREDSSEYMEPVTPTGKARRPNGKGKGKSEAPAKGMVKGEPEPIEEAWPSVAEILAANQNIPERGIDAVLGALARSSESRTLQLDNGKRPRTFMDLIV